MKIKSPEEQAQERRDDMFWRAVCAALPMAMQMAVRPVPGVVGNPNHAQMAYDQGTAVKIAIGTATAAMKEWEVGS